MIVLSTHLDDAVWSACAWLAEHDCELVTVCAGVPPQGTPPTQFDQRDGFKSGHDAMLHRRAEDREAAELLGVKVRHLDCLDAGYGATEGEIEQAVADELTRAGHETALGPLGLSHPDHIRVAEAFRTVARERRLDAWCYEDLPYAAMHAATVPPAIAVARCEGQTITRLSPAVKEQAFRAYRSQVHEDTHWREILGVERYHRITWHGERVTRLLDRVITEAAGIPGWMSFAELLWLGEEAARRPTIIEVGSFQGRSAKVMANMTDGRVYCVDDFRGAPGVTVRRQEHALRRNLAHEITRGKVEVVKKTSIEAAADFPDAFADMIFIDGDHAYPAPADDVRAWRRVLKPGGLLCGHDSWDPDVERSLLETVPGFQYAVDNIWRA